jgi:hypothetical protein
MFPDRYESQHWVVFKTGDSNGGQPLVSYTLTGVALATVQGTPGQHWNRPVLDLSIPIPQLPANKGLTLVHWAPYVGLSSIANDHEAVDAGWAVDSFRLLNPDEQGMTSVEVTTAIAVRDIDGFILRVGYVISLLGYYADIPKPDIR